LNLNVLVEAKIIPNLNKFIHDSVVNLCIDKSEITTEWFEEVIRFFVFEVLHDVGVKTFDQFVEFILFVVFIQDHWNVHIIIQICPKACWPAVVA
jgi:hypothetical protein